MKEGEVLLVYRLGISMTGKDLITCMLTVDCFTNEGTRNISRLNNLLVFGVWEEGGAITGSDLIHQS